MIHTLHKMGIRSSHMYWAGAGSVAVSFAAWLMSQQFENAGQARADRWGIFVGEWAPTFIAMGVALAIEETHGSPESVMREREEAYRRPEPAGAR
jgi:hypothetical protein